MVCQVCGLPDDGYHFKVLSCRACAAFFRRSVIKQAKYVCKFANKCQLIKELRKTCPACRLSRCKEVGMREKDVQCHRDKNGPLKQPRLSDRSLKTGALSGMLESGYQSAKYSSSFVSGCSVESSPTTSSSCSGPLEQQQHMATSNGLLNQILSHVQEYFQGERALYIMLYHSEKDNGDVIVFHEVSHVELIQMDRGCLSLVQQMIFQINPSMELLSPDLKLMLLRSFFSTFSPLRKCYLTSLVFPDAGDIRLAFHFGQYISSVEQNFNFFKEDADPKKSLALCQGIHSKAVPIADKFRYLRMREIEFAALAGIMLANEIDLLFNKNSMADFRDQIYRELHDDICRNYSIVETASRFGSLICLLQDIQGISKEIEESVVMCKLFSPHKVELWD